MPDHMHRWAFVFKKPAGIYFAELPCHANDAVVGEKIREIVETNKEHFRESDCRLLTDLVPDDIEIPGRFLGRFNTHDELRAWMTNYMVNGERNS